jgi:hypothetical protein
MGRAAGSREGAPLPTPRCSIGVIYSINVIASEAKQSSFIAAKLDCFVANAPRNDVARADANFKEQMCTRIPAARCATCVSRRSVCAKGGIRCAIPPYELHARDHANSAK